MSTSAKPKCQARGNGSDWAAAALDAVIEASGCYPAHLQVHAAAAWTQGTGTEPVTADHVHRTLSAASGDIDAQYLAPRWRQLGPHQRAYVTALALCDGDAPSGRVAAVLGTDVAAQTKRRQSLLGRGEIWDPEYRHVALSMPAMGDYAKINYPATVAANPEADLPSPRQMMQNLDRLRSAPAVDVEPFPSELLNRRLDAIIERTSDLNRQIEGDQPPAITQGEGETRTDGDDQPHRSRR